MSVTFLGKKYKTVLQENFDEYMKALGVNVVLRKFGCNSPSDFILTDEGDGEFKIIISSVFKRQVLTFKLGEEFEETTMDGRKVKTTFTLDGNVLTQIQKGEKTAKILRTFSDQKIDMELSVDDIVATIKCELIK